MAIVGQTHGEGCPLGTCSLLSDRTIIGDWPSENVSKHPSSVIAFNLLRAADVRQMSSI
jgi:hypothetical protein